MNIKITGTGCYIPSETALNSSFYQHEFLDANGVKLDPPNQVIIDKFKAITGITERRYAKDHLNTSDLAFFAAEKAIEDANVDPETLDYIIVAHNFGDVRQGSIQGDTIPCLAARVKHSLQIKNPKCVAYDLLFGCPGWVEGLIQAQAFIRAGMAKKCLVIGAETLSRVIDKHDRDAMIFSDGAGATVVETSEGDEGILACESASYTRDEAYFLYYGTSFNKSLCPNTRYIKMYGRKIYEFACTHVPQAMKECLDKSGVSIDNVKKIFIHQANEKMDEAILKRFFRLYKKDVPQGIMPMNIQKMGNSSVATIPTLLDMVKKGEIESQSVNKGDVVIFASVGAGMNINAVVYKC
ncbi:3-oxoacyl-ACP synthase III family protein [Sinomicrobium weinanense]|uniref:Ketoacyl-ACP synthase III n=1 Tax=Sinomicrobium weinanense TaxID=2842200 RepID=A0A926JQT9_9FLAO|nr:ketoacyl-ACP synthase III [Sinomicrobium weinanense]MBC9795561.1 ketoacyl-ACP synthase III [Sinomicrobium weinanense]MBU3124582.1 ketoacyl-ACP synthase III [Sinomicrobium weinanense]